MLLQLQLLLPWWARAVVMMRLAQLQLRQAACWQLAVQA
jgi:hypothetical protein